MWWPITSANYPASFQALLHPTSRMWRVGCNSFDIVCVCVCVCVCLCVCVLPLSRLNRQTYRLEFRYVGQLEGYLGQLRRSRSCVKDQGHWVKKRFSGLPIVYGTEYIRHHILMVGLRRGVFSKRMRFFSDYPRRDCRDLCGPTVDRTLSVATTALPIIYQLWSNICSRYWLSFFRPDTTYW